MPENPLNISPELLHHIASYLDPQDLFSCIQVNHFWNRQCIPLLWHTIDDSTPGWDAILRGCLDPTTTHPYDVETDPARVRELYKDRDQAWVRKVFRKYGRFVRVLHVHWWVILEAVSLAGKGGRDDAGDGDDCGGGCTGLESLTMDLKSGVQGPKKWDSNGHLAPNPDEALATDPLFPEFSITRDDFIPARPVSGSTAQSRQGAFEFGWVLSQHHWHTILKNRRTLKRLHLLSTPQSQCPLRTTEIFFRMMSSLEVLQELTVHYTYILEMEDVWTLLEVCPRIEALTFMARKQYRLPDPVPDTIVANARLRTLSLRSVDVSINGFLTLLGLFPNLSTLRLGSIGKPHSSLSAAVTAQNLNPPPSPPFIVNNLSSLTIGNSLKSLQAALFDYDRTLRPLPNLLTLLDSGFYDQSTSRAIMTHCPKLEAFRSTSNPWYVHKDHREPNDPANQFLVDCATLKEFNFIEHTIWVYEMLRQPWACLGLEWLCCRIVGVSRLNRSEELLVDCVMKRRRKVTGESDKVEQQLTEEEAAAVEKFHQCERQHHGVYDQLASLTRLKHLDLGYESRYPWTFKSEETYERKGVEYVRYPDNKTFDTLELSLESGLDRLGALKNLEMFGFECLNHRIGRKELDWMAKSWPRLRMMYGLDKERLYKIEHDEERAALKEYFEELRPDVVHDSLFQDYM